MDHPLTDEKKQKLVDIRASLEAGYESASDAMLCIADVLVFTEDRYMKMWSEADEAVRKIAIDLVDKLMK